jgi:hypothetical protein
VGGVVGVSTGIVENSYSISAVIGVASGGSVNAGGIAGKARGLLQNCLGINSTVSGSGQILNSGKIIGYDSGASLNNCFGFAGASGWGDGRDGIPIFGDAALYFELYGPEGLGWDISEDEPGTTTWLADPAAHYILPVLRQANLILQKNQMLPDHLLYF